MIADRRDKLAAFVAWAGANNTGDEEGQAQIFLDRLFQAFGQNGSLDVGGQPEFRIRQTREVRPQHLNEVKKSDSLPKEDRQKAAAQKRTKHSTNRDDEHRDMEEN